MNILKIDSGAYFSRTHDDQEGIKSVDVYDFPRADLSAYECIAIDGLVDQEFLYKHRETIRHFLDEGKIVVFSGNLFLTWLPGASPFIPKNIQKFSDYNVSIQIPHPIFNGVLPEDMTYNRGVAGFFARGHHPLPSGAEVLLTLPGDVPITYIDRDSTRGTMLVHSGMDLFSYDDPNKSTGRIQRQLIQWVEKEYRDIQERRYVR